MNESTRARLARLRDFSLLLVAAGCATLAVIIGVAVGYSPLMASVFDDRGPWIAAALGLASVTCAAVYVLAPPPSCHPARRGRIKGSEETDGGAPRREAT